MDKYIAKGFGLLLLTMAVAQFLSLSAFNHIILSYITPLGGGGPFLTFAFPLAILLIGFELLAAVALLAMDSQNAVRPMLIKLGIAAMIIWSLFILTALLRNHPMGYAGFFGGKMRQPLNWLAFVQSLVFVGWGIAALQSED